jgi:acyl-CoA synthetase (AMP-forming)/AMP-acid ligase II
MTATETAGFLGPPSVTLSDIVTRNAFSSAATPAFVCDEDVVDWQTFNGRVNRVANALIRDGQAKGDRVAFLTAGSIWAFEVFFGIMRAGTVMVPLSTLLAPDTLAGLIGDAGARLLFVGQGYEEVAIEVAAQLGDLSLVFETDVREGGTVFADFIGGAGEDPPKVVLAAADWCNLIYSSGTTGVPKGIVHSHAARLCMAFDLAAGFRNSVGCRSVLATPPSSNGTMLTLLPTVALGGTCVVMRAFDPGAFLQIVRAHRPTHTFLVPTQFQAILDQPDAWSTDFSCFEALITAGAPMPPEIKQRVRELTGERLYELWGLTEGVGTIISPQEIAERPQSVGLPTASTELRLIDDDGHQIEGPGTGEIVGRSGWQMNGYLNRPDANAEIRWYDEQGRLFMRTGDIAERDEAGYYTIRGRSKDMIISGGINLYPVDLETVLLDHPEIRDVSVVGVPHDRWGETPVGIVILERGSSATADALKDWANDRLAKYQRLHEVVIRTEDLPRNALGKVLKNELAAEYLEGEG